MKVYILTEGGKNIGFGHITRCISLYQAFEGNGIMPELIVNGDESILDLFSDKRHRIFNWIKEREYLFEYIKNADIVVIDSYLAKKDVYDGISELVKTSVYIDDNKRLDYPRGVVMNGSIYAEELDYPKCDKITYLLGTKYALLRKEFWKVPEKEIKEEIESVMVTFGGSDMHDATPRILKLLIEGFPELRKNVVIGRGFKNIRRIENLKNNNIKLAYYPNAERMKNIMLESDIAISAGGQTLHELARIGSPAIAVFTAKNQLLNIKGWARRGFVDYVKFDKDKNTSIKIARLLENMKSFEMRNRKSKIGNKFIDGEGSLRTVDCLFKRKLK